MRKILMVLLLVLPWLGTACMNSRGNMGPTETFQTAYQLAQQGKFDETKDYFTDDILNYMKLHPDVTLQSLWNDRLNNGTLSGLTVIEKSATETTCDIKFMYPSAQGTMDGEDTLVYENGMWKFDKMKRVR